ncbi:ribonuclease H-like domain-containing protein [Tanacetum coccineum]
MHVSGHVDIFDMVDINLFTVVALNMMFLKLGYTGESEPMFYNYLRPLTSLDEGLYALACEEDVRCLAILVRSFKLIEVYIEHGVTVLDSYLRAPRETTKEPVCDSDTPRFLPQHDLSTPCKDYVYESITPKCMPDCILTPPTDESVITYTQLSGVHGVDTQSHVLPTIQSQFSDINLSFVSQQETASQVIDDVMRQLSFDETELDGEAGFADVAGSGVDSSELSHDESFGVDDLDLNLNELVNLNVSQVETQSELLVFEEPDVGPTQEPILADVSTQEPIMAEVSTQEPIVVEVSTEVPIVEEVETQEFSVEDVVIKDYVSSGEDVEQGTDDDDDVDEEFLVDKENEIVEPDVDVHLFGISMDLPFDNIGITNLVPDDVLEREDVDVINTDGFDSDPGNDEERNYRKRRLAELRTEMEGVINASGQWKYSFCTGQKFSTPKEAKDRVYLHFIESRRNLKLPTGLNRGMEAGPSGSSGPTTRSKKRKNTGTNDDSQASPSFVDAHDKRDLCPWVLVNPDIPVKAVQDQLQRELWRACKRDLLGLDGAFMKGPFPGQVLVVVGLDSNNGIYPLAYVLVEAETKSSWCWLLQCLGDDIDLHPNSNFTFISDRQKSIIQAIKIVYPSRAKSNLLLNNICDVFNGKIVRGRDKPVITLLEYIREYCMKRIMNVQDVIDKCIGPLTLINQKIMGIPSERSSFDEGAMDGANKYQVLGIPCKHVVAACWNMALNDRAAPPPETWVGRPKKKRKRSKHEDEPFVKDGKLSRKGRTITCQSCRNTGHNKATCKGQGRKATTAGNNAEGSGLSAAAGEGGACVVNGREIGDGVPTQSSAAGGASEWSFL